MKKSKKSMSRVDRSHAPATLVVVATLGGMLAGCTSAEHSSQPAELKARYEHAAEYLPWTVKKYVQGLTIRPHWSADGASFWYEADGAAGPRYYRVDLDRAEKSELAEKPATPEPVAHPPDVVASPNGRWGVRVIDGNLYRVELAGGQQKQLTFDAEPDYVYGLAPQWTLLSLTRRLSGDPSSPFGVWSPDGHRFLTYRIDERGLYKLPHLVAVVPGEKHQVPYAHFQNTAWPSSEQMQEAELMVLDMRTGRRTNLNVPKPMVGYSPMPDGGLRWSADGTNIYAAPETHDFRSITLYEVDAGTGRARAVVSDGPAETALQPDIESVERFQPVGNGEEFIVYSERSDWGHYYLYDGRTGNLKNPITRGEWAVHGTSYMDAAGRWLYFTAGGREDGHDPYYSHLYRVHFDGSELTLLTPENAHHRVQFSPDGRYFIDSYSTVSEPPVHVLRSTTGERVLELDTADTSALEKLGWTPPVRFSVKAADGETDLYGMFFLPADFDERRSYPIVDATYGANFTTITPRSFLQDHRNSMALAQLGFVAMSFDGRGTPLRSQSMQDLGFGSWDVNLEDHVAAIRQLSERYEYIDIDRAGVYGHSAGGFATVHAMLEYPELFKVGVATAGSHDFDLFVYPVNRERGLPREYPEHYEPTNYSHADRLQGKLLLAHGFIDDDVHVATTLQMADALIRADKDFDMFIHPTVNHQTFYRSGYLNRKVWDYFVEHLRHETPPGDVRVPDAE